MVKKTQKQLDKQAEEYVAKEFQKLRLSIFDYMKGMNQVGISKKDVMKITKADCNYLIKSFFPELLKYQKDNL
tara:strand:+ start:1436 stop:1654 length:219 start_codon:yes stop_codon:yes gene_type:complete